MQALEAGAVDVILKPKIGAAEHLAEAPIRSATRSRAPPRPALGARSPPRPARASAAARRTEKKLTADAMLPPPTSAAPWPRPPRWSSASAPRPAAPKRCARCSRPCRPMRRVSSSSSTCRRGFTAAFAKRLNSLCEVEVKEAETAIRCLRGHVLIAPGDKHMLLERRARAIRSVKDGPLVSRHRPSVDVLFRSAAQ
jgi:two-component system chemotaxis response regulator CheB